MGFPHIRVFMTVAGKKFLPAVAILENKKYPRDNIMFIVVLSFHFID